MKQSAEIFNILSAVLAFAAAMFWFQSAAGKLPPMLTYYGGAPQDDPFYKAFVRSVKMSRTAALYAGLSAVAMALAVILANH